MSTQKRLTDLFPTRRASSLENVNSLDKKSNSNVSTRSKTHSGLLTTQDIEKSKSKPQPVRSRSRERRQSTIAVKSSSPRLRFGTKETIKVPTTIAIDDTEPIKEPSTPPRKQSLDDDIQIVKLSGGTVSPYRPKTTIAIFTPKKSPSKSPQRTPGSARKADSSSCGINLSAKKIGRSPSIARDLSRISSRKDFVEESRTLSSVSIPELNQKGNENRVCKPPARALFSSEPEVNDTTSRFSDSQVEKAPETKVWVENSIETPPGHHSLSQTSGREGHLSSIPKLSPNPITPSKRHKPCSPHHSREKDINQKIAHKRIRDEECNLHNTNQSEPLIKEGFTSSISPDSSIVAQGNLNTISNLHAEKTNIHDGIIPTVLFRATSTENDDLNVTSPTKLPKKPPPTPIDSLPLSSAPLVPKTLKNNVLKTPPKPVKPIVPPKSPITRNLRSRGAMMLERTGIKDSSNKTLPPSSARRDRLAQIMNMAPKIKVPESTPKAPPVKPKEKPIGYMRLPSKYEDLSRMFEAVDMALRQAKSRQEVLTLKKAKVFVEDFCRRSFDRNHLAQIATVVPDFYTFKCVLDEKVAERKDYEEEDDRYRLLIDGDLSYAREDGSIEHISMMKMVQRKEEFYKALLARVTLRHQAFLSQLEGYKDITPKGPMTYTLRSWHPKFNLEALEPIEYADLPKPERQVTLSAKEMLKSATKLPSIIQQALDKVAKRKAEAEALKKTSSALFAGHTISKPSLTAQNPVEKIMQGGNTPGMTQKIASAIPLDLLEKVREREMLRNRERMYGLTDVELSRIARIQRCDHISSIISSFFAGEPKKNVMPLDRVVEKVRMSSTAILSSAVIKEIITTLTVLSPEWISEIKTENGCFVRIDKSIPMATVRAKIQIAKDAATKGKNDTINKIYSQ